MSAARRHKKHHHEEHENDERWLVSFADMMTLLFALFMVLFAISSVNTSQVRGAAEVAPGRVLRAGPHRRQGDDEDRLDATSTEQAARRAAAAVAAARCRPSPQAMSPQDAEEAAEQAQAEEQQDFQDAQAADRQAGQGGRPGRARCRRRCAAAGW